MRHRRPGRQQAAVAHGAIRRQHLLFCAPTCPGEGSARHPLLVRDEACRRVLCTAADHRRLREPVGPPFTCAGAGVHRLNALWPPASCTAERRAGRRRTRDPTDHRLGRRLLSHSDVVRRRTACPRRSCLPSPAHFEVSTPPDPVRARDGAVHQPGAHRPCQRVLASFVGRARGDPFVFCRGYDMCSRVRMPVFLSQLCLGLTSATKKRKNKKKMIPALAGFCHPSGRHAQFTVWSAICCSRPTPRILVVLERSAALFGNDRVADGRRAHRRSTKALLEVPGRPADHPFLWSTRHHDRSATLRSTLTDAPERTAIRGHPASLDHR